MIVMKENTLSIKQYEEVIKLQDFQIDVKMKDKLIKITGLDLSIQYYSEYEIVIQGTIQSMVFY